MFLSSLSFSPNTHQTLYGAPTGFDARILAELAQKTKGTPLVAVALDELRAALWSDALAFFAPSVKVLSFPAWDCLPYDRSSPQHDIMGQRISVLARLTKPFDKPTILITTINAIDQKILPPENIADNLLTLAAGNTYSIEKLTAFLVATGYASASAVRDAGEFAVRGGILDVFPPCQEDPVRIDFFGDDIDSLRFFDAVTQTTTEPCSEITLLPVSEVLLNEPSIAAFRNAYRLLFGPSTNDPFYEAISSGHKYPGTEHWIGLFNPKLVSLLDYLPTSALVFDWQAQDALKARFQQIEDFYQSRLSLYEASQRSKKKDQLSCAYKPAPIGLLYLSPTDLEKAYETRTIFSLSPFQPPDDNQTLDAKGRLCRNFAESRARSDADLYADLYTYAKKHQAINKRVAIACYSNGSMERIAQILKGHSIPVRPAESWDDAHRCDPTLISLFILGLEHGFEAPDLVLITEQDILGDRLVRPSKKKKVAAAFQLELGALEPGDFVVHADHGVGRYEGLVPVSAMGITHDCVKLVYDGGDKLFIPVENLDLLSRYGSAEGGAVLDKLGGAGWQSRKSRVKKKLKDMADALLKIAAERSLKKGELIELQQGAYQEFAARFPYAETDDQATAIEAIFADLSAGKPMDRLVCGDVGFGKTEVALRAAFASVMAGLQVALVVPTTLLARQHYNNFKMRFSGFPIKIGQLSRMVPAKEAKEIKESAKKGEIDIIIGTHAILSKEMGFSRLGLLIVDEEQHFGVKQKERLKEMRADVHVLTLTATPIPRTLQLALTGVRELSLITTPPVDRLAVRTSVLPYDPLIIREALMREHYRGGQSFYVCPRIEDIAGIAEELRALVPEVKIISAHGRMSATELEDIMTAFDAGRFDVLLATNIVESGLDIPNANTIVIHRSDIFGLSQLYQLRGRVGRSKKRGFAYLTYPANAILSSQAQQRLEVIQNLDQLGAGFQLASHDMDIRGAGNILGEEQSGHIREVGIELYQQMLEEAVEAARARNSSEGAQEIEEKWTPQINLGMSILIPDLYVKDLNVRLGLYRRLADVRELDEIDSMAAEMIDRFGSLPEEVQNLFETVSIKTLCRKASVDKIDAGPKGAVISFHNNIFQRPERLVAWINAQKGTAKVRPDQKIALIRAWNDPTRRLEGVKSLLTELAALV